MASQVEARPPPPPSQPPMLLPSPSNTAMQQQTVSDSKPAQPMKSELPQLNGNMGILKQELFTEEDLIKDEAFITDEFLEMSPITPSPPAEGTIMNTSAPTTTKSRPPRKSTLTQQQKNQKRQRATTDQLQTLEIEFNKNPTPTANVRERIAAEINMTERSVQIWFQNRRAKIKNLAKKSIETGEDCDAIPESMKKYLAMQAMESGKPFLREAMGNNGMFSPYGNGLLLNADNNPSKTVITHFSCNSLTIGSWRRIGTAALDLVVFYSPAKSIITYYINADASGYKIEYPFSYIKNITLDSGDLSASAEGANQPSGGLIVELSRPPHFQMDHSKTGFYPARDFTEDQQASQVLVHHLGGHPKVLSGQLAKLVSLDSFRNRHRQPDAANMAASAPVSPIGMRPASQPNHLVHPHIAQPAPTPQSLYPVAPPQPFEMGPPLPRGHKRQRSRSVPIAMDFSQMRQQPVPHFQIPQFSFQHSHPNMQPMLQAPAHLSPMPLGPQVHQSQQTLVPPSGQPMSQQPQPSLQHYHQLTPPRQQAPQQQSQQPQQLRQHIQPQASPQPLPPPQHQQAHAPSMTPQPLTPQPSTPGANGQTQIYAPVPQHHHQGFGPVGPTLRIDISSGYSFDFRHAHPMSATPGAQTTATTDSDTPIFSAAVSQEPFSAPPHQSTFPSGPFLSPQVDPSHLAVSAAPSPLSTVSHSNEPFIVNQSPPMTGFDRSPASNDTYPTPDETTQENYIDPNAGLADPWGEYDLFSKQHFSLPFRATGEMTPKEEFDFQDMIDFNEPLSLSPDTSFVTTHDTTDPISTNRPQST